MKTFVLAAFFVFASLEASAIAFNMDSITADRGAWMTQIESVNSFSEGIENKAQLEKFVSYEVSPFLNQFRNSDYRVTDERVNSALLGFSSEEKQLIREYADFLRQKLIALSDHINTDYFERDISDLQIVIVSKK